MRTRRNVLLFGAGTALAGVGVSQTIGGADNAESDDGSGGPPIADVAVHASESTTSFDIELAGTPIVGSPDATLDLYYWSDYQCPFCGRVEEDVMPQLLANEIEAGTVRMPLLAYPNIGDDSLTAAIASRCVWRQVRDSNPNAFLRWHVAVFDAQGEPNSGWASRENLLEITADVADVDATAVEQCLNGSRRSMRRQVTEEKMMARHNGISVTPGFIVYNPESGETETITGAQPYERFRSTIESVKNA